MYLINLLLPEAANDQLAQLVANLQAKSDLYDVIDMDVIREAGLHLAVDPLGGAFEWRCGTTILNKIAKN